MNCSLEKTLQFSKLHDVYDCFFDSKNDREEILKKYKEAIAACKTALKLFNKTDYHNHSRFEACKCIPRTSRCARGPTKAQAVKLWKIRLKFLTEENDMVEMVNKNFLKKYIFDVIKSCVFDKGQKIKPNE